MSIPDDLKAAQGAWSGESRLQLRELTIRIPPSRASVTLVASGKFLAVRYDWVFEGTVRRA